MELHEFPSVLFSCQHTLPNDIDNTIKKFLDRETDLKNRILKSEPRAIEEAVNKIRMIIGGSTNTYTITDKLLQIVKY